MWIVQLALRRPYTFIVMALLLVILGVATILRTPTDIFPNIDIPVVSVIWSYGGVSPVDMEKRIATISERAATTTVADIEHIESQSMPGVTVIKFFFQPGAKVEAAIAQLTSINQTILRVLPTGATSPLIIRYNASSVPILQIGVSGQGLSESQLYDMSTNFVRTQMATVRGASIPLPYGGKPRQIMVDLDIPALQAHGMTPNDVITAINAQNLLLPAGTTKMGQQELNVFLNSSPNAVALLGDIPVKQSSGTVTRLRDVAQVHDGFAVQQNMVRLDGHRSVLLSVLKSGSASTLSVVEGVRAALPRIAATLPPELRLEPLFDQSVFVRASIQGVLNEAVIAACLTAAMILLFLGSWRSTVIVAISIPLSILSSIILLGFLGQTMNLMTLGGLALAVGILVDDATVEIENIHRNLGQGKPLIRAILDGAQQIAGPTFVATTAICIVFVSVVFLTGPAKYLFTPLALAVVFAMASSYLLSRTLIPVLVRMLLHKEIHLYREAVNDGDPHDPAALIIPGTEPDGDFFWRVHQRFNRGFERFRASYSALLKSLLERPAATVTAFVGFFAVSFLLVPWIGEDFFPAVDAGQFRLHVRAPAATRLEQTERRFTAVENTIREIVPPEELGLILDNIGLPVGGVNLAFTDSANAGPEDGEILVSLKEGHRPTADYVAQLRKTLREKFPDMTFFFQPADIVSQILNFGLPAPLDVQIIGRDPKNYAVAQEITRKIREIPGAADVHIHQVTAAPSILLDVDRQRASQIGLTQRDVANNVLVSLSSSGVVSPNYWLDPKSGVNYLVAVQTPQYKMNSVDALYNTPVAAGTNGGAPSLLSNIATISRGATPEIINHYNVQPTYDIYVNVQGRDLGGVTRDLDKVLAPYQVKGQLPRGTQLMVRGQAQSMRDSFTNLGIGIVFAILMVYLLMVVNFQSWLDPFLIITALPGALSGILWMLFVTQTTFSVPSLMGAIMCVGVATANSILLVTFANDRRQEGDDATSAAYAAGFTRLRPVLMTALAMVIGMLPMALGLGEGGEQNAPLGRAVIGGLIVATVTTLLFVPVVYSLLRRQQPDAKRAAEGYLSEISETRGVELSR